MSVAVALPSILNGCTALTFAAANFPATFGSYKTHRDIKYGALERQALDVYVPSQTKAPRPVVIFVHGGSWISGSKDRYRFVADSLTSRGYIAVLPNYRLFPDVKFPAFVDDVAQALAWTHSHAAEFGGDPQKIFFVGHSAGAHIAAMILFDPQYLARAGAERAWIKGFVGLAGPYDFLPLKEQYLRDIFGPESRYAQSQPINFVAGDAATIPPTLLIHGEDDQTVWPKNSKNLTARLRAIGASVKEHYYANTNHTDLMAAFSVYYRGRRDILNEVDDFISSRSATITARAPQSVDFGR
ncbi:MAG TPA: alpha/beta hydrolase [Steroidobacteraceae bacterium]|nr:alpha/beta hydrolase [Steroidobacteraceae bacterium]